MMVCRILDVYAVFWGSIVVGSYLNEHYSDLAVISCLLLHLLVLLLLCYWDDYSGLITVSSSSAYYCYYSSCYPPCSDQLFVLFIYPFPTPGDPAIQVLQLMPGPYQRAKKHFGLLALRPDTHAWTFNRSRRNEIHPSSNPNPNPPRTYYLGAGALIIQGPLRTYYLGTWWARAKP